MKNKRKMMLVNICSIVGFVLLWQAYATYNKYAQFMNPKFLPTPTDVLVTFKEYWDDSVLLLNISVSMIRIIKGFVIGFILSLGVGYLSGKHPIFENIVEPIINIIAAVPLYAFLPLFIIWFGIGETAKIILIAISVFLPIYTNVVQGIKSVDPLQVRMLLSLGAGKWQLFRHVIFPTALPYIFTGLKSAVTNSFAALVVAEMIGADTGLGFIIVDGRNWFKVSDMFMAMVCIAVLSSVILAVLKVLEKRLLKWNKEGLSSAID